MLQLSFKGFQKWYILELFVTICFLSYLLRIRLLFSGFGGGTGIDIVSTMIHFLYDTNAFEYIQHILY